MERPAQGGIQPQRWLIYRRLQELGVPCRCGAYGPLEIEVDTPQAALLVWSVVRQVTSTRAAQAAWLERCWQAEA
ncbi:MAG: hypothetical protein Q6L50_10545 [Gloeomargarita sp. GMQP_bins_120]